jgi:hypothetical protein
VTGVQTCALPIFYDKKFIFKAQSITPDYVEEVPILFVDGVIVR